MSKSSVLPVKEFSGHMVLVRPDGSKRVYLDFSNEKCITEQSHLGQTDVGYLVNQFLRSGQPAPLMDGVFNDYTDMPSYQECLNMVQDIDHIFENLPIAVKTAFDQSPALFMQALEDPSQRERLTELGVFERKDALLNEVPQEPNA